MADFDLFLDEEVEDEAAAEEGANRTFIILVGALSGLLALGICAFVAWAFLINPRMRASIEATNAAVLTVAEATTEIPPATTQAPPEVTEPPAPTDTPRPAQTDTPTEAPEATEPAEATEEPAATAPPAEVAEGPTATPRPTATRRPTATPRAGSDDVPDTGVGLLGASALAVGLVFLLAIVRRIRRAV